MVKKAAKRETVVTYAKEMSAKAMSSMSHEDHWTAMCAHLDVATCSKSETVRKKHMALRDAHRAMAYYAEMKAAIELVSCYNNA